MGSGSGKSSKNFFFVVRRPDFVTKPRRQKLEKVKVEISYRVREKEIEREKLCAV